MPVKNAAPWLEDCIFSVLAQKFSLWEMIAVDDFSTDQSIKILQEFSLRDKRIKVFKNQAPGITNALELAFNHTSGNYISRMDADDIMPPHKIETLLEIALKNTHSVATGKVEYFGENKISEGYLKYQNWLNTIADQQDFEKHIFRECVIASPNWLTHRKNIEAVLPFAQHQYPEDYDLVFRWIKNGLHFRSANTVTHLWREHSERTSRNRDHYNQKHFFWLKLKWFLNLKMKEHHTLVVFGENKKADLCVLYFQESQTEFVQLKKNNFKDLHYIKHPLLLCTVYTSAKVNKELEAFFDKNLLVQGVNWWYV